MPIQEALSQADISRDIHFEPGLHPLSYDAIRSGINKIHHGDMNAHAWDGAVAKRISDYKPSLLAIDSLEPDDLVNNDLQSEDKIFVWYDLPAQPSDLNDQGHITVLVGDTLYGEPNNNTLTNKLALGAGIGTAALGGAVIGSLLDRGVYGWRRYHRGYDYVTGDFDTTKADTVTRRQFLGAACCIATGLTFNLSPTIAAGSPQRGISAAATEVATVSAPLQFERYLPDEKYIDGRTALLIEKTGDALAQPDYLDAKIATVLMGDGHIFSARSLMASPALRARFIRRHTEAMYAKARAGLPYFDNEKQEGTTTAERIAAIELQQQTYYLVRVDQPNKKRFKYDAISEINRSVRLTGQFQSVGVRQAIAGLDETKTS